MWKWGIMDITKFCAEEDGRYGLSRPWSKDGWRYATDGRIVVRVPTDEPDSERAMCAELLPLFAGRALTEDREHWQLVPTHDGKGKDWEEPACCGADDPPKACKRWGKCSYSEDGKCTNTVKGRTFGPIHCAGKKWQGQYIKLLNDEMPDARYTVNAKGYMVFRAGDVEGLLAPMKK